MKGTSIRVTATPFDHYYFKGWSKTNGGSIISTDSSYSFTISSNTNIYANFVRKTEYTVTLKNTTNNGTVEIYQNNSTSAKFDEGDKVTVTAKAKDGYIFKGWWSNSSFSGNAVSTASWYTFTVSANKTLYAKFEVDTRTRYTLTVNCGEGGYIVGNSTGSYVADTHMGVFAYANDGYRFKGWSKTKGGAVFSSDYAYQFYINANTTLYANFEKIPYYTLKVAETTGFGYSTIGSNKVSSASFIEDSTVTVFTYAASGYTFAGYWDNPSFSGNPIQTSNHYTAHMDKNITLYPKFVKKTVDTSIFIQGVSNTASNWTNANNGSSLNIASGSGAYLHNSNKTLKLDYKINTNDQYGGYAGRSISLDSTFNKNGSYDGIGFWYLTPSGFNGQIALCIQSNSAGLDDLIQLTATNGQWKYYFYETSKTNIDDITLYINGSKNGYTTTSSNGVASGTFYLADMKLAKK